ncbi:MAG: PIN domain-containing protein [Chloroflexi bacterium]|nr:PIN domain-containing protein [Chloroflexota bacterium]MCL5275707.1 PIN domain-containing protein [Chloroflexota bacterium]
MSRVYLDACCLNRPFDDQRQARIRLESEAIILILARIESGKDVWIGSEVLDFEISRTPDQERRRRVQAIISGVQERIALGESEIERTLQINALGFDAFDAAHIACAESGLADILLTTDDRLIRKGSSYRDQLHVRVENPMVWLAEVSE